MHNPEQWCKKIVEKQAEVRAAVEKMTAAGRNLAVSLKEINHTVRAKKDRRKARKRRRKMVRESRRRNRG